MAKEEITVDMWLHILSKTVANYAAAGARVEVEDGWEYGAISVHLYDVWIDDERFHPDFRQMIEAHVQCLDCGVNTSEIGEDYMVFDDVWQAANPEEMGRLCVGCLEKRLGRELGPADFTHVYTNVWSNMDEEDRKSERLLSRLKGGRG